MRCYLANSYQNKNPLASLTREQAAATTYQESRNLLTAYRFVLDGVLTIDQAKQLTEEQRKALMCKTSDATNEEGEEKFRMT